MNVNSAGQTHDQLQAACWYWATTTYHPHLYRRLIMIPNDGIGKNKIRAKQYQAMGLTPGAWDMVLFWFELMISVTGYGKPVPVPLVIWFEFKVGDDYLKDAQIDFKASNEMFGHRHYIISEEWQFKLIIDELLKRSQNYIHLISYEPKSIKKIATNKRRGNSGRIAKGNAKVLSKTKKKI